MTEPIIPEGPLTPDKPKRKGRRVADLAVQDPEGEAWHAQARRNWRKAERENPDEPISAYAAIPLPDFNASRPAFVSRDLLGRFLQDRDTGIVHDCHAATEECGLDSIRNGTFFHFWSEVLEGVGEDLPCPLCLP